MRVQLGATPALPVWGCNEIVNAVESCLMDAEEFKELVEGAGVRLLNDRYHNIRPIGRGGQGTTDLAGDSETRELVAIKKLHWQQMENWKAHELFERETEVLRSLNHPQIPDYVDAFEENDAFYLVQRYVPGKDLATLLDEGQLFTDAALATIFVQVLDILEYLHSHSPPVLHRDIKPANIILKPGDGYEKSDLARPDERGDSQCMLVDFGAVQTATSSTVGGSTVVGTPGYMPLEQLQGRAVPATDLYGLATTLAHLASGIDPSDMDVVRGKLQVPDGLLSGRIGVVIQACLEPHVEDRPQSVAEVRAMLRESSLTKRSTTEAVKDHRESLPAVRESDFEARFWNGLAIVLIILVTLGLILAL